MKWALLGLALTALVAAVGGRPPLRPDRGPGHAPPPPRVEYVDALAAALVRAKPDDKEDRP